MQRVLVYGATGGQGGAVVRRLLERGHLPVALVRSPEEASELQDLGAETVEGDLEDLESLRRASGMANRVFLSIPQGLDTAAVRLYGRRAIDAAAAAGVDLLVFNTGTRIPPEPTGIVGFEEKRELEAYLRRSSIPYVTLRPTFYLENLAGPWTAPGIVSEGVIAYPVPAGVRAAWIGWRDMAALAVAALEQPHLGGRRFDVGGPAALTGAELAARFSAAMGREIRYVPIPLDAFQEQLAQALGEHAARGITSMYRWLEEHQDTSLFLTDVPALTADLPVNLTPAESWIEAQHWLRPAAVAGP